MMQSALPVLVSEYRLNVELYTSLFSIYTYSCSEFYIMYVW